MKGDTIGNDGQERDGKIQPNRAQHTVQLKYQMNEEPDVVAIVITVVETILFCSGYDATECHSG